MAIMFSAPQVEYELIREEWLNALSHLGEKGVFVGGPSVTDFEESFAAYSGTAYCVGVNSGTDALYLALKALEIGPGDEVIAPVNTFIATVNAIYHTGAKPVLVDCGTDYLMDMAQARSLVTARTKAVIPVHLYGQMADMNHLRQWAPDQDIAIVEDGAQAVGSRMDGRPAGSWGTMGCFSFYPDKNLGALGDGGAICLSSQAVTSHLRKLRNHGGEIRYVHEFPGYNSRLDPIQACALKLKLTHIEKWCQHRRQVAAWYDEYLDGIEAVTRPALILDGSHSYHLYVIRVVNGQREALKKFLQKKGILTAIHYPSPIHLTPAYADLGGKQGQFPNAERYADEILSLPMHIAMTESLVAKVAEEIRSFFS
ncbi:DegT/DnrJ/EryC1/StrS family aminotransferase [Paenibacillus hexagrammi]|uniref:DegT/DnrJ/EryC1/StrS family aminotransferase n=1 Tax=Paenibacillus hexagrammi TaxID=2908839 RepID=A0ABY3SD55_9BACL|nr:DegT/DnrJ/EryC1/StrS family aminotransferase [Paenibacillus sp. YPD9-1]UJF31871.1 DegT/DnrJ/EryC1/StrS family aminotransferase [Paenibacillus sp. YPD9-1]